MQKTETYSISGLLDKELGESDHLRVVVQRLGKVNHSIRRVLLIAVPASGEKTSKRGLRERVALIGASSCDLSMK